MLPERVAIAFLTQKQDHYRDLHYTVISAGLLPFKMSPPSAIDLYCYCLLSYLLCFYNQYSTQMLSQQLTPLLLLTALLLTYSTYFYSSAESSQFKLWKKDYSITFQSALEDLYRQKVFYANLKLIKDHNQSPTRTYDMGLNQFSALTKEQFVYQYLKTSAPSIGDNNNNIQITAPPNIDIDWVQKGAVAPPKNQGQCGAAWAFSCIGGLQGLYKIAFGVLRTFSQQQLVDCSGKYGNQGCNGGIMSNGYKYVIQHGICTEQQYPYKATVQTCKNCTNPWKISSFGTTNDCNSLINALSSEPVSVTIDATNWATYRSGVFSNCAKNLNHAALLVGITNGVWRVKNSWGSAWGESGYIRLAEGNTCGICMSGSYPIK